MLLTIQYPIADCRVFLGNVAFRHVRPNWPDPAEDEDFIRSFGIVKGRVSGGIPGWVGEGVHCEATRCIRFLPGQPKPVPLRLWDGKALNQQVRVAFRRFYSDGTVTSKAEIGLLTRKPRGLDLVKYVPGRTRVELFLKSALRTQVNI